MRFEWDENKNEANQKKHDGVDFRLASRVFDDPPVLIEADRVTDGGQERLHALGRVNALVLLVVHINLGQINKETKIGEEIIRIISARTADKRGLKRYFQQAAD